MVMLAIDCILDKTQIKPQWMTHPTTWWVPVNDLLDVYHRMGKETITQPMKLYGGNTALFLAGYGERIISPIAYPYLRWKMPWTAAHYYDWPEGGMLMDEEKVAEYMMNLWDRLNNKKPVKTTLPAIHASHMFFAETSPAIDFAQNAMESGAVSIPVKSNDDGSIELQLPVINEFNKFKTLVIEFLNKLIR